MLDKWLNKLERKFGRYSIPNLMYIIIFGMAIVFVMDNIVCPATGRVPLSPMIYFDKAEILSGQIWRIITFIFLPEGNSAFFLIFELYFLWLMGSALESQWGTFKFNMYYLTGIVATIITGTLVGGATNVYLNLTLFLAFAILNPDFQIMLFFILPIKVKYIAILDAVILTYSFVVSSWQYKLILLVAVANLVLFFGENLFMRIKQMYRRYKIKKTNNRK